MQLPKTCACGSEQFEISASYEPDLFMYVICKSCRKNWGFIRYDDMDDERIQELVAEFKKSN